MVWVAIGHVISIFRLPLDMQTQLGMGNRKKMAYLGGGNF
jgi:hypothetical protein